MGTGFLPAIFRFKVLSAFFCFILVVGSFLFLNQVAYAGAWFSVAGSGVLSGSEIVNNSIPISGLPTGFNADVVQHEGSGGMATFGSLVSSEDQDVERSDGSSTDDSFFQNTGATFPVMTYPLLAGLATTPLNCSGINSLDPASYYTTTTVNLETCLGLGTYGLSSDGLTLIFVTGGGDLNVNQSIAVSSSNRRALLITDQKIVFGNGASIAGATFDTAPNVQTALFSTYSSSESLTADGSGNPFILEGPIVGQSNLNLQRDAGAFPGVYVKYNPFYVAELSKKGVNGLAIQNLLESKTSWRYD